MCEMIDYLEWSARQSLCTVSAEERALLQRLVLAVRPDLSGLVSDLSDYDLVEEAAVRGVQHPLTRQYCPELIAA